MDARIHLSAANLPRDWPLHALTLSVLYNRDDAGEWSARALEMDLEAYGKDERAATKALIDMVILQVTFAIQKKDHRLVLKDAPAMYWQMYERARGLQMQRLIAGAEDDASADVKIGTLPIPASALKGYQRKKPFTRQHAT